jgi:hypothetical protein
MSDSIDQAQNTAEFYQQIALAQALKPRTAATFTGHCLNCEAPVDYPRRWCDFDCMTDWEKENA